jgi:hypothetical protein
MTLANNHKVKILSKHHWDKNWCNEELVITEDNLCIKRPNSTSNSPAAFSKVNAEGTSDVFSVQLIEAEDMFNVLSFGVSKIKSDGIPVLAKESSLSANAIFSQAAFNQANTSFITATSAGIYANGAFAAANNAAGVDLTQNNSITAAFTQANTGVNNALSASNYANGAFTTANSATNTATAAYTRANNSVNANTGGTITGDLVVTGNLTISGQTTYSNTVQLLVGDNLITLNAELPTSVTPVENAGIEINRGNTFANSSLLWIEASGKWQANSGSSTGAYFLANEAVVTAAFLAANSAATLSAATDATQNANITSVTNTATAAFLAANSAATLSAATDATQNTNITNAQNTGDAAFLAANSAATLSAATDLTQNNSITAAFNQANTDFTNVSVAAGTYGNTTHYGVVTVAANGRVTAVQTFVMQDPSALAFSIALG